MLQIGRQNRLQVVKIVDFGLYLEAGEHGTILLPARYVPEGAGVGDWLEVFVYSDSEDLLVATTETPLAQVGECAYLKVVAVTPVGAFVDWGLSKDLLVPFNEQSQRMEVGRSYVVYLYLDESTDRVAASSKLSKYLPEQSDEFQPRQQVKTLIAGRSELGYKAVIEGRCLGLIYANEVFQPLRMGQQVAAYIKTVREDGKLDLTLNRGGKASRDQLSEKIIDYLQAHDGVCQLTDKSPPEMIYDTFGVSKGKYKKALGGLYKQRQIVIEKDRITLVKS